ncbi:MAG: hypothetical protein ACRET8_07935 [Burkholderiales bacterium]
MSGKRGRFVPAALVAMLTLAFAVACAAFVAQPTLASFADDSVSYLVVAQTFSPWQGASAPVAEAFAREAFYPPLFPLLLALAGAAHDMARAHAATALMLAACLPLVYLLGARWLGSRALALAIALAVALLPALWINAKGILSEPLFCLVLLATLCVLDAGAALRGRTAVLALLMAALVLTRTVGLPAVAAYALWVLTRRSLPEGRMRALIPVFTALAAYAIWVVLRPPATADGNVQALIQRGQELLGAQPLAALLALLLRQANAMAEAWMGSLMVYWVAGSPLRPALACAAGLLALVGLAMRFVQGKPDAWMLAAYLLTYLLWPFQDQMERFLFPALPVLVLYAFDALPAVGRYARPGRVLLSVLLLSLSAPAMVFLYQRAHAPGPYAAITDWYRKPDLAQARARAKTQLDLLADMQVIRSLTKPGDRVMWVAPSYLALLADRRGVPAPPADLDPAAYRAAVRASEADYVFLSLYHPRDTIRDSAWRAGVRALTGYAKVVHARTRDEHGVVTALLLKVDRTGAITASLDAR